MMGLSPYRRRYALGERLRLRVPSEKFRSVVLLVDSGIPRATGFFVGVRDEEVMFPYIVTARHCIEETAGRDFLIRLNVEDGYEELPTVSDDWFIHDSEDVAAVLFSGSPGSHYNLTGEGLENLIDADYRFEVSGAMAELASRAAPGVQVVSFLGDEVGGRLVQAPETTVSVEVGHEVLFISLLYEQHGQEQNLPVARFGHVARMPQEPIWMKRIGGGEVPLTAYLVECHSWGGTSGSPVFWRYPTIYLAEMPDPRPSHQGETTFVPQEREVIALMGLVSAHWDIEQRARHEGDVVGEIRTAINSGIAVVTPAEAIRQLLTREDVVEDRKERAEKHRAAMRNRRAVTPDSASEPVDEFAQFEKLTGGLLRVPKKDIDEKRKDGS